MSAKLYITFFLGLTLNTAAAQSDSLIVLTPEKFLRIVENHHPVARQADIQVSRGIATLQSSRGSFDPKIYMNYDQKYFDDKTSYSLLDGGLKIPTWFGMEIKAGIEQNEGLYLNPEHRTPDAGLWYAGVSIPIGQGLFIDKRRTELKKARIYMESSQLDQQLMINNLLYEAGKTYWEWFSAYHTQLVFENALNLAEERFAAVKQSALLGDNPAIDTLEAGIQVQNQRLNLQQAQLDLANAAALLSVYLWSEGSVPLELAGGTIPISISDLAEMETKEDYFSQLDTLIQNHPELKRYRYKIDQLMLDKRWKKEQFKPSINLNYYALSESIGKNPLPNLSPQNYKWGLDFNLPIFLRKERGEIKLAELKIKETELDLSNKQAIITYKVQSALNEWFTINDQIMLYDKTIRDYQELLNGERHLFDAGESSLFMINSREMGYIQARLKLIDLAAKSQKSRLTVTYHLGIIE